MFCFASFRLLVAASERNKHARRKRIKMDSPAQLIFLKLQTRHISIGKRLPTGNITKWFSGYNFLDETTKEKPAYSAKPGKVKPILFSNLSGHLP
jgi:hypothetical protein